MNYKNTSVEHIYNNWDYDKHEASKNNPIELGLFNKKETLPLDKSPEHHLFSFQFLCRHRSSHEVFLFRGPKVSKTDCNKNEKFLLRTSALFLLEKRFVLQ